MSDRRLTPELVLAAYAAGIFPMAETRDSAEVFWVDPQARGILPLDAFHLSRSLGKRLRKNDYTVKLDWDIEGVLDACADREDTWINDTIRNLIVALFNEGHAHTIEIYAEDQLIGGVYGIALGGAFFGESMFSRARDGSKIALAWLIDHLNRCGFTLFDTQFLTPHLASLGAIEISRDEYRERLAAALGAAAHFNRVELEADRQALVQRMTQTS